MKGQGSRAGGSFVCRLSWQGGAFGVSGEFFRSPSTPKATPRQPDKASHPPCMKPPPPCPLPLITPPITLEYLQHDVRLPQPPSESLESGHLLFISSRDTSQGFTVRNPPLVHRSSCSPLASMSYQLMSTRPLDLPACAPPPPTPPVDQVCVAGGVQPRQGTTRRPADSTGSSRGSSSSSGSSSGCRSRQWQQQWQQQWLCW